jgi:hypothetical protein
MDVFPTLVLGRLPSVKSDEPALMSLIVLTAKGATT